ncbi:L-dopachrome tautomerase-related protein [Chishuiella sp.]|uniref:L-dopachrome tautomerase-related protein n=1 Tax=Chishuiella sp. TaxID=1969467 RepID=UPI0028AA3424|nr:L-dopachrome tautomerase-related protein [Chishuiella sp.]
MIRKRIKHLCLIIITLCTSMNSFAQKYHNDNLITAASLDKYKAIGVSVNSNNRLFVSFPKANDDYQYGLTEIVNGERIPYPNIEWNKKGDEANHFVNVQDLFVDANDFLWVLDSKPAPSASIFGTTEKETEGQFKLLKINTKTNKVERIYTFDDLDKKTSGLNDIRVDVKKNKAYFSDPGQAAIIVLDLNSGKTRKVLEKTQFTLADPSIVLSYDGIDMRDKDGKPFLSNVNGIALTHDFKYFYFKPINKNQLFRIETKYLVDEKLSDKDLEQKVENMGDVGITHGLIADKKGNIYLTTSLDYTIKYLSPDGKLHTLIQDSRLIWPDSLGIGTDGYLYFSCAQLPRDPKWNDGENRVELPYRIFKVKLPQ